MIRKDILFGAALLFFGIALVLDIAIGFEPARAHAFGMAAFLLMIGGTIFAFLGFKRAS